MEHKHLDPSPTATLQALLIGCCGLHVHLVQPSSLFGFHLTAVWARSCASSAHVIKDLEQNYSNIWQFSFHCSSLFRTFPTTDARHLNGSIVLMCFRKSSRISHYLLKSLKILHCQWIGPRAPKWSIRTRNPSQVASIWCYHKQAVWICLRAKFQQINWCRKTITRLHICKISHIHLEAWNVWHWYICTGGFRFGNDFGCLPYKRYQHGEDLPLSHITKSSAWKIFAPIQEIHSVIIQWHEFDENRKKKWLQYLNICPWDRSLGSNWISQSLQNQISTLLHNEQASQFRDVKKPTSTPSMESICRTRRGQHL